MLWRKDKKRYNMRKIYLLVFSLLFFLFSANMALAHEVSAAEKSPAVDYELPYPGLLPDNPLYVLKVTRDRIISFLISDPLKKAEFDLLQADKRLNAGIYLLNSVSQNEKRINLAISTISKAENYFGEALENIKIAGMQGIDITEMGNKLMNSSKKHQEILSSLEKKADKAFKPNFSALHKRTADFETQVKSLMLRK